MNTALLVIDVQRRLLGPELRPADATSEFCPDTSGVVFR